MPEGELRRRTQRFPLLGTLRAWLEARAPLLRRLLHLASPLFLSYYAIPPDAWLGLPNARALLVLGVLLVFLVAEAVRLWRRWRIPGLRAYEADQISAFTWGGMALALALLLFPMPLVIPALVGLAWVDPLCARTRGRPTYPWLPLAAYGLLAGTILAVETALGWIALPPWAIALLAALGAAVAVAAEAPRLRYIDDDFRMLILPLVALALAASLW